jgi:FMN phosphatase YigB (HAD superfamily)
MNLNGKVIALDIGGVCVRLRFDKCYQALGIDESSPQAGSFFKVGRELGKGAIIEAEWLARSIRIFNGRFSGEQIRDAWNLVIGAAVPGMKRAMEALLARGYRFAYLSDTSSVHMDHLFRTKTFVRQSMGGVYSYEVGISKPGLAMYEAFENTFGLPCFYTDDSQVNVDAALSRGWRAELFTNSRQFLEAITINEKGVNP